MAEDRIKKRIPTADLHGQLYGVIDRAQRGTSTTRIDDDPSAFKIKVYDKSMPEGRTLLFKDPINFRNRASDGSFTVSDAGGRDIFFLEDGQWNGFGGRAPVHRAMKNRFEMEKQEQERRRRRLWWKRVLAFLKTVYFKLDDLAEGRL